MIVDVRTPNNQRKIPQRKRKIVIWKGNISYLSVWFIKGFVQVEYFVNLVIDIRLEQKQAGIPTIPQAGGVYLLYYSEAENWPIAATEIPRITVK